MKSTRLFEIKETQSIAEAFGLINQNASGCVFIINKDERVVGIATDGDIRRWLIKFPDATAQISLCMNSVFTFAQEFTPREAILKMLDHRIHVVPRLSDRGKLLEVITRQDFPLQPEKKIFAQAKAPVRISFGGGGSDLTHYFVDHGGAVMNATISMYSHATLRKRPDGSIVIYSKDLEKKLSASSLVDLLLQKGEMDLILSLIQLINPDFGFELQVGSEFPVGSGLGGSAVVLSCIIGCFNQFREDRWDNYEMAEIAFQAERLFSNIAGGWQDQYATIFGGFNFMEFSHDNNIVHPLRIQPDIINELGESLLLCYTGNSRKSGQIHIDQKAQLASNDQIRLMVARNKELTYRMKTFLLRGQLIDLGHALHETWLLKRQFSPQISNSKIDQIYELARENGALGGKLLGAGGGGYFLLYAKPFKRFQLQRALEREGLAVQPFTFDHQGLQCWTVREYEMSKEEL